MIRRSTPGVLALCAVAAAGGLAACDGGTDAKPGRSASAASAAAAPSAGASRTPAAGSVLDEPQLKRLLVTSTDISDFDVEPVRPGGPGLGIGLGRHVGHAGGHARAEPAACQALQDFTGFGSAYDPHAFVEQKAVYQFTNNGEVSITMSRPPTRGTTPTR